MDWNSGMDEAWILTMYDQHRQGKRVEPSGWKKESWVLCARNTSPHAGFLVKWDQCRNHRKWWFDLYTDWKFIGTISGFGWNPETLIYDAEPSVWDSLISSKPALRRFRYEKTPFVMEMETIFDGRSATGREANGIQAEIDSSRQNATTHDDDPFDFDFPVLNSDSSDVIAIDPDLQLSDPTRDLLAQVLHQDEEEDTLPTIRPRHRKRRRQVEEGEEARGLRSAPQPTRRQAREKTQIAQWASVLDGLNSESKAMTDLWDRALKDEAERQQKSEESFPKQAFNIVRRDYPPLARLLTYQKSKALIKFFTQEEPGMGIARGEFFVFLEGKPRDEMLQEVMANVGIMMLYDEQGEIYGEEDPDTSPLVERDGQPHM